jgi:psiF repeat
LTATSIKQEDFTMTIKMFFATLSTVALLSTGVAHAQTATPDKPAAAAKPAAAEKKVQAPRSEKSLACSKDADGKGLHGKPRKKFMSECKKA